MDYDFTLFIMENLNYKLRMDKKIKGSKFNWTMPFQCARENGKQWGVSLEKEEKSGGN